MKTAPTVLSALVLLLSASARAQSYQQFYPNYVAGYHCGADGHDHGLVAVKVDYGNQNYDVDVTNPSSPLKMAEVYYQPGVGVIYDVATYTAHAILINDIAQTVTDYYHVCNSSTIHSTTVTSAPASSTYGDVIAVSGFMDSGNHSHIVVGTDSGYVLDYRYGSGITSPAWRVILSGVSNIQGVSAYQPDDTYWHAIVSTSSGVREIYYTSSSAYSDTLVSGVSAYAVAAMNSSAYGGVDYGNLVFYGTTTAPYDFYGFFYGTSGFSGTLTWTSPAPSGDSVAALSFTGTGYDFLLGSAAGYLYYCTAGTSCSEIHSEIWPW